MTLAATTDLAALCRDLAARARAASSRLAVADRNYFGMKCDGDPGPIALGCHDYPTTECDPAGRCRRIVDSFRTLVRAIRDDVREMDLQEFVQRLAMHLTTWQATTFLIGEYAETETHDNPVFTMADGIIWLTQRVSRNSMLRKVQILKMRGLSPQPGLHTVRISDDGIEIFPRLLKPIEPSPTRARVAWIHSAECTACQHWVPR